jgi:class I fructose-bisphosphate aldolase
MRVKESIGKAARLQAITQEHGPGNGKMLILPIDQGLEHGPRDFFGNPESADPEYNCASR